MDLLLGTPWIDVKRFRRMLDQLNGVEERLIYHPANIRTTMLYRTVLDDKDSV